MSAGARLRIRRSGRHAKTPVCWAVTAKHRTRKGNLLRLVFLAVLTSVIALLSCQGETVIVEVPADTPTPQPTYTPYPTPETLPTHTTYPSPTPPPTYPPYPTPDPLPTQTPYPTSTPQPTYTPYPTPTAELTPTPYPTPAAEATATPYPTPTAVRIVVPAPTREPPATATPSPTPAATATPTATPTPELLSYAEVLELVQPTIVRLQSRATGGSGFIVRAMENSAYIATNSHVTEGREMMVAIVGDRSMFPAIVVGEDSDYDYAILWVCCSPDFVALPVAEEGDYGPGDEIGAFGYPQNARTMQATWGFVGSIQDEPEEDGWDQKNEPLNIAPGNSGGPVVGRTGSVVGVSSHTILNQPFGRAVSARAVRERLPVLIGDHQPDESWPLVNWKEASISDRATLQVEATIKVKNFSACDTSTRAGESCNPNVVLYREGVRYSAVYGYRCGAWCVDQNGEMHNFYPSSGRLAVRIFDTLSGPHGDDPWHLCIHDNTSEHPLLGCTPITWTESN